MAEGEAEATIQESIHQFRTPAEVPPAPAAEASDEGAAGLTGDTTVLTIDETAVEASPALETLLEVEATVEETAPEETTATLVGQPAADTESDMEQEPAAVPADEDAAQMNAGTVTEAPYKVLARAREAFWLRDFEVAEQQYRQLTQLEPDNPDGYGELGNMYFSQGKWDEAAAAYYEAGTRLLQEGLVAEAREMLEVIRGLNGPQADDLEGQIAAATTSSP
jgi:tetratricopeptide (TPR) repeat protein